MSIVASLSSWDFIMMPLLILLLLYVQESDTTSTDTNTDISTGENKTDVAYQEKEPEIQASSIDLTKAMTPQQKYNVFNHGK